MIKALLLILQAIDNLNKLKALSFSQNTYDLIFVMIRGSLVR